MIVMLIVSVTISTSAQQYHRFLNPDVYKKGLSVDEYKTALRALFSHQNESKWWNSIPTCNYDQMRNIYAEHLKTAYGMDTAPTDEAILALVDLSTPIPAPVNFKTAGIVRGTSTLAYFPRPSMTGEVLLAQGGVAWTSVGCGNPTIVGSKTVISVKYPEEEFDQVDPRPKTQFASHSDDDRNINVNRNNNGGNGDGGMNAMMMMMLMQNMNNQRQPAAEVVVKNKANAWEVIAGVTGLVNVGLNTWDLLKDSRNNRQYSYSQNDGGYRGGYNGNRGGGNNGGWNGGGNGGGNRGGWQGGSGDYRNDPRNANSGSNGSIWGGNSNGSRWGGYDVSTEYRW